MFNIITTNRGGPENGEAEAEFGRRQFLIGSITTPLMVSAGGLLASGLLIEPGFAAPSVSLSQAKSKLNAYRGANGRGNLATNSKLQKVAATHAALMASKGKLAHSFGASTKLRARTNAVGFAGNRIAENIAAGQTSLDAVLAAWKSSSGHRRNMLGQNYNYFGLAVSSNSSAQYVHYWALVLGS